MIDEIKQFVEKIIECQEHMIKNVPVDSNEYSAMLNAKSAYHTVLDEINRIQEENNANTPTTP